MNLQDIIGQKYTIVGTGRWLRTMEHDSLVIDTEDQIFFWNSRGIIGDAVKWLTEVEGIDKNEAIKLVDTEKDIFSTGIRHTTETGTVVPYQKLVEVFYERGKSHREYWHDVRGYTDTTIDRFKLGYTGEWYTIPIFDGGTFKNFQCRKQGPDGERIVRPWYKGVGPLPFNFSNLLVTDWVVITEGPPDAIMLRQHDIPAVSQTGAAGYWSALWVSRFNNIKKIYVCYDNDEAGNIGSVKLANMFGYKAQIYNMWDFEDRADVTSYFCGGGRKEEYLDLLGQNSRYVWGVPLDKPLEI